MFRFAFTLCCLVMLLMHADYAREPLTVELQDEGAPTMESYPAQWDLTKYVNEGGLLMFVTNLGGFGRDAVGVFGFDYGTFFPYKGVQHIQDRSLVTSPLYAAGIWAGGRVNGQTRVAIAEYSWEYCPGPMVNGTYQNDRPEFRVYKLYGDSLAGNPNGDYLSWPVSQGAPLDSLGLPLMRGRQMLWSVFNDANVWNHDVNPGSTPPLGVEIKQTTWIDSGGFAVPYVSRDRVEVTHVGASSISLNAFVSDFSQVTGHDYAVVFDSAVGIGTHWKVIDLTTGETRLDNITGFDGTQVVTVDGMTMTITGRPVYLSDFSIVSNGNGILDPPVAGACASAGFPTPGGEDPGDDQQVGSGRWAFHTVDNGYLSGGGTRGSYSSFLSRVIRDPAFVVEDSMLAYEVRFTGSNSAPGINGGYARNAVTDIAMWVPFELWRTPAATLNDGSDDLRLLPLVFTENSVFQLGSWGSSDNGTCWDNCEHSVSPGPDDPYTDYFYWCLPADQSPGESGYLAFESELLAGGSPSIFAYVLARTVFVSLDAGEEPPFDQLCPEQGTTLRFFASLPTPPDTFLLSVPSAPAVDTTFSAEDLAIYLEYVLVNKSGNIVDSFFVSIWADPDLGSSSDDLIGSDSSGGIFYCYNASDLDLMYGTNPPAIGFKLLSGNSTGSLKNLALYSAQKYINGTDPANAEETYNYMRGLQADGSPYLYNGSPTRFVHAGDPVTGFGDLDDAPSDKRMMGSIGPFTFNPGDTQTILVKMAVAPGADRLSSVTLLREILNYDPAAPFAASTAADPDPIPPLPKFPVYFYLGNLEGGVPVQAIDPGTIRLNGTLPPDSVEVVTGFPGFSGEVLRLKYRILDIQNLYAESDFDQVLTYTFGFGAGEPKPFVATGSMSFAEITVGDISGDGRVSLTDLTQLVAYMFQGGRPPHYLASADTHCDGQGQVTLTDLTNLVNYLFLGGAEPELCAYWLTH